MPINVGLPELLLLCLPAGAVVLLARLLWLRGRAAGGSAEQDVGVDAGADLPEPTVAACYAHAWERLRPSFWVLFLAGLVSLVLSAIGGAVAAAGGAAAGLAVGVLVEVPLSFGGAYVVLRATRGEGARVGDLFAPYRRAFVPTLLAGVFVTLATEGTPLLLGLLPDVLGVPLLLVGWVFLTTRLSFVPYVVVDERREAADAVLQSWRRTGGRFWTLIAIGLAAVPVLLAGLLLLVVGLIPAFMLVTLAHATLFASTTADDGPTERSGAWYARRPHRAWAPRLAALALGAGLVALLLVGIRACAGAVGQGRARGEAAARHFHDLYNAGRYDAIYASADPALRRALTGDELAARLTQVRARLGGVVSASHGCVGVGDADEPLQLENRVVFARGEAWETFLWRADGAGSELALLAYAVETGFEDGSADWEVVIAPPGVRPHDHSCTEDEVFLYRRDPAFRTAVGQ